MKYLPYNHLEKDSIISYAKKLKNQTLRQACSKEIEKHDFKGTSTKTTK